MSNYSYQTKAAINVLSNLLNPEYQASVLAATPGAGKTTIAQIAIEKYLKAIPNAKVVVLTHGQTVLREQWISDLKNSNTTISFSYGEFGSDAQVQIGVPQSINKLNLTKLDLLVVDEAHQWYLQPSVQTIIKTYNPKHQMLLTGSPSEFNKLNNEGARFGMYYISAEDLESNAVFAPVEISIAETEAFTIGDKLSDMIKWARINRRNLSKIVVAVKTVQDSANARRYLESIGRKVVVSTGSTDPTNDGLNSFKAGEFDTLVLVNKGNLGFSDNSITGIFDLKCSSDLDTSTQLFARVLRKHPLGIKKFYYRVASKKNYNREARMCVAIKGFMGSDVFRNYDGNNLKVAL